MELNVVLGIYLKKQISIIQNKKIYIIKKKTIISLYIYIYININQVTLY